jgi:hypothetical protein
MLRQQRLELVRRVHLHRQRMRRPGAEAGAKQNAEKKRLGGQSGQGRLKKVESSASF